MISRFGRCSFHLTPKRMESTDVSAIRPYRCRVGRFRRNRRGILPNTPCVWYHFKKNRVMATGTTLFRTILLSIPPAAAEDDCSRKAEGGEDPCGRFGDGHHIQNTCVQLE